MTTPSETRKAICSLNPKKRLLLIVYTLLMKPKSNSCNSSSSRNTITLTLIKSPKRREKVKNFRKSSFSWRNTFKKPRSTWESSCRKEQIKTFTCVSKYKTWLQSPLSVTFTNVRMSKVSKFWQQKLSKRKSFILISQFMKPIFSPSSKRKLTPRKLPFSTSSTAFTMSKNFT